jgi:hypothetical protein
VIARLEVIARLKAIARPEVIARPERAGGIAAPVPPAAEQPALAHSVPLGRIVLMLAAVGASTIGPGGLIAAVRRLRPAAGSMPRTGLGAMVIGIGRAVTEIDSAASGVGRAVTGTERAAPDRPDPLPVSDDRQVAAIGRVGSSADPNGGRSRTSWTSRPAVARDRPRPRVRRFRPAPTRSCSILRCVPSCAR